MEVFMRANNLLFIFLVIAIIFVLINISITFIKIYNFKKDLIGYASGYVNITINTLITINMSRDTVNWSSGIINSSALGIWQDVNKTSGGTKFCSQFSFRKNSNEIYIDILITVPSDSGNVGEQFDTITIIGDAVN